MYGQQPRGFTGEHSAELGSGSQKLKWFRLRLTAFPNQSSLKILRLGRYISKFLHLCESPHLHDRSRFDFEFLSNVPEICDKPVFGTLVLSPNDLAVLRPRIIA